MPAVIAHICMNQQTNAIISCLSSVYNTNHSLFHYTANELKNILNSSTNKQHVLKTYGNLSSLDNTSIT
jgi:hypothetical protein